ncbi:MAG: RsmB/NOP family class I SAM-dependent RNA methyltransferase, partial [Pseudomonadota bacterium]
DRHAIADLVWDAVRCKRSALWSANVAEEGASGRDLIRGRLMSRGEDPSKVFNGEPYGPAVLTDEEQHERDLGVAPRAVRLDYPDWLGPHLADVPYAELDLLRDRAPLDLRVNALKATRSEAAKSLEQDQIETAPAPLTPLALRVTTGERRVRQSAAYLNGLVEIQDSASQAIVAMAPCTPGTTVLDLCCGGGGKTLALAAMMQGSGRLLTHDIDTGRMADLPSRAARAGITFEPVETKDLSELSGQCDVVVADVPCSGTGAWRRTPDAKWRLTPARLIELRVRQKEILLQAQELAKPSGKVLYSTCSLLACENAEIVQDACTTAWQIERTLTLRPSDGGDGFFGALMSRVTG